MQKDVLNFKDTSTFPKMNVAPIKDLEQEDEQMKIFLSVMRYIWPFLPPYVENDPNAYTLPFQVAVSYDIAEMRTLIKETDAWEDTRQSLAVSQDNC